MKNVRNIIYKRIQKIESAAYCGPPTSKDDFKKSLLEHSIVKIFIRTHFKNVAGIFEKYNYQNNEEC